MNKYRIHWNKTESLTTWADSTTEAVILAVGERIQDGLPFEIDKAAGYKPEENEK